MADTSLQATTVPTPEQELAALAMQITDLSKLAIPAVVAAHVAAIRPTVMFEWGTAPTPDEMETAFPSGPNESGVWYVVCVGRQPGLYFNSLEADEQVKGVPNQFCQKKTSRREALDFYHYKFDRNEVKKLTEVPIDTTAAPSSSKPLSSSSSASH
ncbi:hypothetical protein B0H19DRAFT_1257900 [Mycena capillaripes]|nr:hypothetical protein B0H19DRAFT_1257900 [Mycena capillaripes]